MHSSDMPLGSVNGAASVFSNTPVDTFVTIADAQFLFHAEFKRSGTDLTLTGEDGHRVVVPGYFKHDHLPTLLSADGSALTGDIVAALAGPLAPGQYAQIGAPAPSDVQPIGRVATVSGNSTAMRNGVAIALNVGDAVYKGDVVQTAGNSAIAVIFGDGTTFNLTANARMVLNEFVYNPAPGSANSALINLVQGSITFVAGEVAKTGDMKIGTPTATLGIRGTAVQIDIDVNNGQTKMSVLVEPNGVVGSFNIYSLSGDLIGTVSNANGVTTVTAAGPLQAIANEVQKTPAELAQALAIVQQVFQAKAVGEAILAANPVPPSAPPAPPGGQPPDPNDPDPFAAAQAPLGTQIASTDLSTTKIVVTATTAGNDIGVDTTVVTPGLNTPATIPLVLQPLPPQPPPLVVPINLAALFETVSANTLVTVADSAAASIQSTGVLLFTDNGSQTGDAHTVGATAHAGAYGALSVALQQDTLGTETEGKIAYAYTAPKALVMALGAGQTLDDVFTVSVTDSAGHVATTTFTVELVGVNDAPELTVANSSGSTAEDHGVTLALGAMVADPDSGDVITLTLSVQHGSLASFTTLPPGVVLDQDSGAEGMIKLHGPAAAITALLANGVGYTPASDYSGADVLTILVQDAAGGQDSQDIAITVTPGNDAPVAVADAATVKEDTNTLAQPNPVSGNVLSNDTDIDSGDIHSVSAVGGGEDDGTTITRVGVYGALVITKATGAYIYTLANDQANVQALTQADQPVTEVFTYTNADNHGGTSSADLTITITGTDNAAIIGTPTVAEVTEDANVQSGNLVVASGTISISDADHDQSFFSTTVVADPDNLGILVLQADGHYAYAVDNDLVQYLDEGESFVDHFTVMALDGTTKQVDFTIHGAADTLNLSFESDFQDWTTLGSHTVAASHNQQSPTDGSQMAVLTTAGAFDSELKRF